MDRVRGAPLLQGAVTENVADLKAGVSHAANSGIDRLINVRSLSIEVEEDQAAFECT
jgi:hypothetical protein